MASPCPASPPARGTPVQHPLPLRETTPGDHGTPLPSSLTITHHPRSPSLYWIQCLGQRLCIALITRLVCRSWYLGAQECCYTSQSLMYALAVRNWSLAAAPWVAKRVQADVGQGKLKQKAATGWHSLDLLLSLYHSEIFYWNEPQRSHSCASVGPLSSSRLF